MRALASAAWYILRTAWRCGPLALLFTFGEVVSTVLRFLQPAMVGMVVGGLADHSAISVGWGTGLLVTSMAFGSALEALAVGYRVKLIDDIGHAFDLHLMRALARIGDLDRLEQPRLATAIGKVRDRAGAMGYSFNGLMTVLIQAAAPVASMCVALAIDPRLLLLTLGGLPSVLVTRRVTALQDAADDAAQPHASHALAWAHLVADPDARAERRVFQLWHWYRDNVSAALRRRDTAYLRPADLDCAGSILAELCYLGCATATLLWVITTAERVSAGTVAAALLVTVDLRGTLAALRFALSGFGPALRAAAALREVHAAAEDALAEDVRPDDTSESPAVCQLTGVTYRHPQAQTPALRDLDLRVEPGQVIAVVGANGAGKSTLVELFLGLRRPTDGRVTLTPATPSVLAQHFARYEFALAEAVALADLPDLTPDGLARVHASLDQASAQPFWADHPDGLAQQLGPDWPGGSDLSGGQWQVVAAARCFHVDNATLVVLDEPTAALDPQAQDTMTARYAAVARQVADRGGIAVLVTHRMAMPPLADRIVVLHEGRIVESGTHAELLAAGGRYARAHHAQASGFREMTGQATTAGPPPP